METFILETNLFLSGTCETCNRKQMNAVFDQCSVVVLNRGQFAHMGDVQGGLETVLVATAAGVFLATGGQKPGMLVSRVARTAE